MDELGVNQKQRAATEKLKNVFATILYSDEMLRLFFREIQQQPDFENTIFIITGDHAMPELHTSHLSPLEKYHVPLIIYSPLIRKPGQFNTIVSHLDITPSLLALLQAKGIVDPHPFCHWLGGGISTSSQENHNVAVSFALNNSEEVEYLRNGYFLSYNRIFALQSGLGLTLMDDEQKRKELKTQHTDFLALSRYAVKYNALVPDYLYFEETYHAQHLEFKENLVFYPGRTSREFISVMKPVPFKQKYNFLELKVGVNIRYHQQDKSRLPVLILEVKDSTYANHFYTPIKLIFDHTRIDSTGSWDRYHLVERVDIGFIPDKLHKSVKMYFWNRYKIQVEMDSLSIEMSGYFRPEIFVQKPLKGAK